MKKYLTLTAKLVAEENAFQKLTPVNILNLIVKEIKNNKKVRKAMKTKH